MTKNALLERRAAVAALLAARSNALVVTGLGSATYDVAAVGDHERNFYLWGAMGGAAMVGLGLALAQPKTPVIVVTGDGEMLMGIGAFATIALQQPANLKIIVLDNELYGETGAQQTHTVRTDLAKVAQACGIADAVMLRSQAELTALTKRIHAIGAGPTVAVIKISTATPERIIPLREGAHNKVRLRLALGLSAD
jgi:thiamine pyrophosphate-dependent acetolactate synthase large subunit-like protein